MEVEEIASQIVDSSIKVHRALAPGLTYLKLSGLSL